ncbi:MAG TPA: nuclear transport factor 2 family protein [Bryobacteraceae bacterium]|nr:nuclear transport factor 2 family protein [Bryobacteraceae bacterium]
MKNLLPCSLMLLLAGCATTPPEVAKDQDVTAEFRSRIEKILAGWSTLDIKNVAPYYAKDAGLVFFDVAPLKYSGWAEYEKGFQQVSATWKSIKLALGDFQATRSGNIVWAVYTSPIEIEPKVGPVMKAVTRATDIFERRGDDWIIVHEHVSAPFEPPQPPAADAKKK